MLPTGGGALPRLFRKLVIGIVLASSPAALAADDAQPDDDDDELTEVDRAIGAVLDSMVDRALAHRRDLADVLVILLHNMHPFDATRSVCEAALSKHPSVRRVLADALGRDVNVVGRASVLHHLMSDDNVEVRHAAMRAARA